MRAATRRSICARVSGAASSGLPSGAMSLRMASLLIPWVMAASLSARSIVSLLGGAVCVPIRTGDKVVGTLGIGTAREHEYSAAEINALQDIANTLAGQLG